MPPETLSLPVFRRRQWATFVGALKRSWRESVVTMNRAIAIAELEGAQAALALLDGLDLDQYRYYHSTRADLLRRLGQDDQARAAYTRALELSQPGPERRFLESRLADLSKTAEHHSDA